jgi:hypothetical protein
MIALNGKLIAPHSLLLQSRTLPLSPVPPGVLLLWSHVLHAVNLSHRTTTAARQLRIVKHRACLSFVGTPPTSARPHIPGRPKAHSYEGFRHPFPQTLTVPNKPASPYYGDFEFDYGDDEQAAQSLSTLSSQLANTHKWGDALMIAPEVPITLWPTHHNI